MMAPSEPRSPLCILAAILNVVNGVASTLYVCMYVCIFYLSLEVKLKCATMSFINGQIKKCVYINYSGGLK